MGWECPHMFWHKKGGILTSICRLDSQTCSPGQGICVLKGKYKISSSKDIEDEETKNDEQ